MELSGGIQVMATGYAVICISAITFFLTGLNNRRIINKIEKQNNNLQEILEKLKKAIIELVAISREMHATVEEQNSTATQQASGITEVSATLEELSITANQITTNAGDLVVASEETVRQLTSGQSELESTVKKLDDVNRISRNNSSLIQQLGKRSKLINQMVEIIKDIANKTNMLSVNASIEASRAGEAGKGFSVVAAEIREMSKETIVTAKKVEETAFEIQTFINDIVIASVSETEKVQQSAEVSKNLFETINQVVEMINKNYTFTQKIDVSITQQENGSKQAAETMRQLTEVANQSASVAKQTAEAVQNIVDLSNDLENLVQKYTD
jgi:methyl-accepting chemotaxis protein